MPPLRPSVPAIKMCLVGDMDVGKTSLSRVFVDEAFREGEKNTLGSVVVSKTLKEPHVTCHVWDTAGQERFRSMLQSYMRRARCALIVYDVCSRDSFNAVRSYWLQYVDKCSEEGIVKILIGNKVDKEANRKVLTKEGEALADSEKIFFMETSAKANKNVHELFLLAAREVLKVQPHKSLEDTYDAGSAGFVVTADDGRNRQSFCERLRQLFKIRS